MLPLSTCSACAGFLPAQAPRCPHCDAPASRARRAAHIGWRLAQVATGGALAMTLMACYGGPPSGYPPPVCPDGMDVDRDGSCLPDDCNDHDPSVAPGAYDVPGDGIDQNCDGKDATPDGGGPLPADAGPTNP